MHVKDMTNGDQRDASAVGLNERLSATVQLNSFAPAWSACPQAKVKE
jgi:hypothetical protein